MREGGTPGTENSVTRWSAPVRVRGHTRWVACRFFVFAERYVLSHRLVVGTKFLHLVHNRFCRGDQRGRDRVEVGVRGVGDVAQVAGELAQKGVAVFLLAWGTWAQEQRGTSSSIASDLAVLACGLAQDRCWQVQQNCSSRQQRASLHLAHHVREVGADAGTRHSEDVAVVGLQLGAIVLRAVVLRGGERHLGKHKKEHGVHHGLAALHACLSLCVWRQSTQVLTSAP